jgi:hypothetical protein
MQHHDANLTPASPLHHNYLSIYHPTRRLLLELSPQFTTSSPTKLFLEKPKSTWQYKEGYSAFSIPRRWCGHSGADA